MLQVSYVTTCCYTLSPRATDPNFAVVSPLLCVESQIRVQLATLGPEGWIRARDRVGIMITALQPVGASV